MKMIKIVYHDGTRAQTYLIEESEYEYKAIPPGYIIRKNGESVFIPMHRIIRIVTRTKDF